MPNLYRLRLLLLHAMLFLSLTGCATFSALEAPVPLYESIYIYSGTRLDWAAISQNEVVLKKFRVDPPRYPWVDLPFSFTLDTLLLPVSIYAEIFH